MSQYQIPGARRPIEGPTVDTTWQPPPKAQPELIHYQAQNALRYLSPARQELHTAASASADFVPTQAVVESRHYQALHALRYASPALTYIHQGAPVDTTWQPIFKTQAPEQARYAQLNALRYLNIQAIDQEGPELFGPCTQLIAFSWSADPTPGIDDYKIELGSASGLADRYNIDTGGTDTFFQANILGGTYFWRVRSYIAGVPQGASAEQKLVVTCDTFLMPTLPAQPDQRRWASLQAPRYQIRALPEVHQGLSQQFVEPIAKTTQPEFQHYQVQQLLRYQISATQYVHQGAIVDSAWQPPPKALPELIHYLQLHNIRYLIQAKQTPDQGAIVDTTWQPPSKTPPELIHYLQLQVGRYQIKAVFVPSGRETPTLVLTIDPKVDLPEILSTLTLGDLF